MIEIREKIIESALDFAGEYFDRDSISRIIQVPKKSEWGDFSLPFFSFQKELPNKTIDEMTNYLRQKLEKTEGLNVKAEGNHINFFINKEYLSKKTLEDVLSQKNLYGKTNLGKNKLVVLDYSAPNIGKPLHVGHIRSTILGDSIIKILNFTNHRTHGINYLGDVGLHLAKTIAAYNLWGNKEKIEKNPEQEILELYVEFHKKSENNSELNNYAQEVSRLIENEDPETLRTLDFLTKMSLKSFDKVYDLLDVTFDETTGQSRFSESGKQIVSQLLDNGVAQKTNDGAAVVKLENCGLPDKVILKSDGTAIYATQDLGALMYRKKTYDFDKLLYLVANEQELYFKQIFKIMELNNQNWIKNCFHISFGMITLPEGKMSTREGNIVYLEELLNRSVDMAEKIINQKNPQLKNKKETAQIVGIGAVKYLVLSVDYPKNISFKWENALNIEGNSAPYIQYSGARANSILKKIGKNYKKINPKHINTDEEYELVRSISQFPLFVESAAENYRPHVIAKYAYDLSSAFNQFYKNVRVKDAKEKLGTKIALVEAYKTTVTNAMNLLGIKMPEKM